MILVSLLVVNAALERENSIGAHYREDFPKNTCDLNMMVRKTQETHQEVSDNGEIFVE